MFSAKRHRLDAARAWWLSPDASQASLTSLGLIASAVVIEVAGLLIWRHAGHRLEMSAVALQLVGVVLSAPVALGRLGLLGSEEHPPGRSRIAVSNVIRRIANRWRAVVVAGFALLTVAVVVFALGVVTGSFVVIKVDAWLVTVGMFVTGWGWWAAVAPRRFRTPLSMSVEVITPLRAADDPRLEAILALTGVALVIIASMLQFAALYQA